MSRKALLLGLIFCCAHNAFATKRMSVNQFEQQLTRLHGKPDGFVADSIKHIDLTERVTATRLTQWLAAFPGKHEQLALIAKADGAAFLDLPPTDHPSVDKPSPEEQQAIITRAAEYLQSTVHRLPDL